MSAREGIYVSEYMLHFETSLFSCRHRSESLCPSLHLYSLSPTAKMASGLSYLQKNKQGPMTIMLCELGLSEPNMQANPTPKLHFFLPGSFSAEKRRSEAHDARLLFCYCCTENWSGCAVGLLSLACRLGRVCCRSRLNRDALQVPRVVRI